MLALTPALASFLSVAFLFGSVLGHCKIVHVAAKLSQPGPRSHGFIVDRHGKYPWHVGQSGDAGGDAPYFSPSVQYVPNPKYPCGQIATLPQGIDIPSSLSQAEAEGVATVAADGSFEALIFQVNRDGGGMCTCEYDTSATAKSWQTCQTLINPPGIQGMWQSDRTNHTAKFQLPSSTVCRGGAFKDKCIVRIRCGFKLRFGGCVAVKTPSSPRPLQLKVVGGATNDLSSMAVKIYSAMRVKGAIIPASQAKLSSKVVSKPATKNLPPSAASPIDAVALQVVRMIQTNNMRVVKQKAEIAAASVRRSLSS